MALTAAQQSKQVVSLYRTILKLAAKFPSIKRQSIIEEIKHEFHANKSLKDDKKIAMKLASARAGIKELAMYSNLKPNADHWTVEIGRDPEGSATQQAVSEAKNDDKIATDSTNKRH